MSPGCSKDSRDTDPACSRRFYRQCRAREIILSRSRARKRAYGSRVQSHPLPEICTRSSSSALRGTRKPSRNGCVARRLRQRAAKVPIHPRLGVAELNHSKSHRLPRAYLARTSSLLSHATRIGFSLSFFFFNRSATDRSLVVIGVCHLSAGIPGGLIVRQEIGLDY